jgi:hypothetical protein
MLHSGPSAPTVTPVRAEELFCAHRAILAPAGHIEDTEDLGEVWLPVGTQTYAVRADGVFYSPLTPQRKRELNFAFIRYVAVVPTEDNLLEIGRVVHYPQGHPSEGVTVLLSKAEADRWITQERAQYGHLRYPGMLGFEPAVPFDQAEANHG